MFGRRRRICCLQYPKIQPNGDGNSGACAITGPIVQMVIQDVAHACRELGEFGNPVWKPCATKEEHRSPVAAEVMVRLLRLARNIFPAQTIDVAHKQQRNSDLCASP
ncbi:UNVERIFIED_ORG: hypothetical protein ABIC62_001251 [Burkholderia sp. 1595]|uniref:Uncharacterized protein n=3 Tax=Paraburkholderia terricola TaxID=169427 RepID=A0ABU1LLI0_9BURK|nr:hypothetical protein [Paraburkholderia terricola]MDR6407597.1 hypothetical protein [Paraburkholderia terricola]